GLRVYPRPSPTGRAGARPSREYNGLASTRSPTYAHRQRRRSAGALHPEGAPSPGTSSTSSMGAVPGSTPDEPILVPPGNTPGWRAPARRRMHTDNAGVAPVRYTPNQHAARERGAPARGAQAPAARRTNQYSALTGLPRVGEHPLADVCTPTTQAQRRCAPPRGSMLPGTVEHQLDGRSPRQHRGRASAHPSGDTSGWRAPARRRMRTDNAGVAQVRYTPKEHAPRERPAPARWAQTPAARRTNQYSSLPGNRANRLTRRSAPFLHCVTLSRHHYGAITMVM